ncbi:MAG: haloacid dehalogenase [Nitrospirae bacterium]|nr:haloacid dehalogenase [Nitrospirota bacterium]
MRFILFDIDGTLIDSGGAGIRALNLAFDDMFSVSDAFRGISMAGKTDLQIVTEGLRLHGIEGSNGIVPKFLAAYVKHLDNTIDTKNGRIMAGIREALEALEEIDDCVLGLLTGNIEQGAMIKLGAFDLARYFAIGAFGDDDADRNRLLPIALEKLREKKSLDINYRQCVVIGDTPRDVDCSKPYGAYSIAVATGPYSYDELAGTEADAVLHDLSDTTNFLRILEMK